MPFLYTCSGISPQRHFAHIIARLYPIRTAIQLSRNAYPSTYLDKKRCFAPPFSMKSLKTFWNTPSLIPNGRGHFFGYLKKIFKNYPSTYLSNYRKWHSFVIIIGCIPLHLSIGTTRCFWHRSGIKTPNSFLGKEKSHRIATMAEWHQFLFFRLEQSGNTLIFIPWCKLLCKSGIKFFLNIIYTAAI